MNRYEFPVPRAAFGAAAVAMTAITLALAVVIPATLDSGSHAAHPLAAVKAGAPIGANSVPNRLRIDVFGRQEQATAFEGVHPAAPNPRHRG